MASAIEAEVVNLGWSTRKNAFVQRYGSDALDASSLILPFIKFLPPGDPRLALTVDAIRRELTDGAFVWRYLPNETNDGLDGQPEGALTMLSFWLIGNLIKLGRVAEAGTYFEPILGHANHLGLFAEMINPRTGELLGNFPQAYSHVGLMHTARNLSDAVRSEGHPQKPRTRAHTPKTRLRATASPGLTPARPGRLSFLPTRRPPDSSTVAGLLCHIIGPETVPSDLEASMADNDKTTVLITGAFSGIGRASALYLARKGYTVIGAGRSSKRLDSLAEDAGDHGVQVATVELDINRDDEVDREMPQLIERFGGIDVLVNNAGYGLWGPGQRVSVDQLRAQFETNFFGPFKLIKHVLPGMVDHGSGKIINISSVEGRLATPFSGAYAASKFALEGLSEAMRMELWPLGVHVCLVEPGLFRTDFGRNTVFGEEVDDEDEVYGPYIERYRVRRARYDRLAGDPLKVAKVVHRIIRSRRPAFRYPVGIEARLGILGVRLVPERLFQSLLSRATIG